MSKTINVKRTTYASMITERLPLRLLTGFLTLVIICGFVVIPIAGAELEATYDHSVKESGDADDPYFLGIRDAVINLVNEIDDIGCVEEAQRRFNVSGSADTKLRDVVAFCDEHNFQSRFSIGEDNGIYCLMLLYYPRDHKCEWHDQLLNEAEKELACSMLMDELNAKVPRRYHPDTRYGSEDLYIYHVEIGNVTFNFKLVPRHRNLDADVGFFTHYLWFTPEIKDRQDDRKLNAYFKFEGSTRDLVVYNPGILEKDILYQNSMMLNLDGRYRNDYGDPEERDNWFDKDHDTNGHRHTLNAGEEHTIEIGLCWDWFCTCPNGSTFEEHGKSIP